MARRWQIIDDDGSRDVIVDHANGEISSGVKVSHRGSTWPAFTQFAVRESVEALRDAIIGVTREFALPCTEVDVGHSEREHRVELIERGELVYLGEPGISFDDRFVTAASSEAIAERLGADGVHFGHEPSAGSLHLTKFQAGSPVFTWCDSLRPGPSFALTFHQDGRCTEQDPRRFALQRMGGDGTGCLDRRAFVLSELELFGVERVDPAFESQAPAAVYAVETDATKAPMLS